MPSANKSRRAHPDDMSAHASAISARFSRGVLFLLYSAGPPVIALVAISIAVTQGIRERPWLGVQAFTAFFIPVVIGAYVMMLFADKLTKAFAGNNPLPWLLPTFIAVIVAGRYVISGSGHARWLLANGALGLMLSVFIIAQVSRGAQRTLRSSLEGLQINGPAMHMLIGSVTAVGILVLAS